MNTNELIRTCDELAASRLSAPVGSWSERELTRRIVAACDKALADGIGNSVADCADIFRHAERHGWRSEWNTAALNA